MRRIAKAILSLCLVLALLPGVSARAAGAAPLSIRYQPGVGSTLEVAVTLPDDLSWITGVRCSVFDAQGRLAQAEDYDLAAFTDRPEVSLSYLLSLLEVSGRYTVRVGCLTDGGELFCPQTLSLALTVDPNPVQVASAALTGSVANFQFVTLKGAFDKASAYLYVGTDEPGTGVFRSFYPTVQSDALHYQIYADGSLPVYRVTLRRTYGLTIGETAASLTITAPQKTPIVITGVKPIHLYAPAWDNAVLPAPALESITDKASLLAALHSAWDGLSAAQKQDPRLRARLAQYAEEGLARACAAPGLPVLTKNALEPLAAKALELRAAVMDAFPALPRALRECVTLTYTGAAAVRVEAGLPAIDLRLDTNNGAVTLTPKNLTSLAGGSLTLTPTAVGLSVQTSKEPAEPLVLALATVEQTAAADARDFAGWDNPLTGRAEGRTAPGSYRRVSPWVNFSDIDAKPDEIQTAVRALAACGIVTGTSPGRFSPDAGLTRAQAAALFARLLDLPDAVPQGFADVEPGDWFYGAVGAMQSRGLMSGTSQTAFSPDAPLRRDQLLAIAARVLREEKGYFAAGSLGAYVDAATVPAWAKEDLSLAASAGLIVPRSDNKLACDALVTRGEAAVVLYRIVNS